MDWRREWKWLVLGVGAFAAIFVLPVGTTRFDGAVLESLHLLKWYAREHVLLCLIPAFFIAGAIAVFVSQASVMKYLGGGANKVYRIYGIPTQIFFDASGRELYQHSDFFSKDEILATWNRLGYDMTATMAPRG